MPNLFAIIGEKADGGHEFLAGPDSDYATQSKELKAIAIGGKPGFVRCSLVNVTDGIVRKTGWLADKPTKKKAAKKKAAAKSGKKWE